MIHSTFATCWYPLNSKFSAQLYFDWMKHMLSEVNHYYLVFFTDEKGEKMLQDHFAASTTTSYFKNPNIKIVIKPYEKWHNYLYEAAWLKNHEKNNLLNSRIEWKVNMLWAEKVHFVNDARINHYFPPTEFYGWCDIGYFRNRKDDTNTNNLLKWPDPLKLLTLTKGIHYACVENNQNIYGSLLANIKTGPLSNDKLSQKCFAGGFFIIRPELIQIYSTIFDTKLKYYFDNNFVVKDDQTILLDCIANNPRLFCLHWEQDLNYDNWFMFQRLLL